MKPAMRPEVTTHWDKERNAKTYRVKLEGTSKFLLFTEETLGELHDLIHQALKGTDHDKTNTG